MHCITVGFNLSWSIHVVVSVVKKFPAIHKLLDMAKLVDGIDAMTTIFEAQDTKPYFGLEGIKAFHWAWQRVIFTRGDPAIKYIGAQFTVTVRVF